MFTRLPVPLCSVLFFLIPALPAFAQAQLVIQRAGTAEIRQLTLSADNQKVAVIRGDDFGHGYSYELLQAASGKLIVSGSMPDFELLGYGYGTSSDLRYVIWCGRSVPAQIVDLQNGARVHTIKGKDEGFCHGAAISPGGVAALLYGDVIEIYNITTDGKFSLSKKIAIEGGDWKGRSALSPDGRYLAFSDYKGKLSVLDLTTEKPAFSKGSSFLFFGSHSGALRYLQFSADGRFIVSRDDEGNLFVHSREGSRTDKHKVKPQVLFVPVSAEGIADICGRTVQDRQGAEPKLLCLPEGVHLSLDAGQKKTEKVQVFDLLKKFSADKYLRQQVIDSADAQELRLRTAGAAKPLQRVSLQSLGLLKGVGVSARTVDGVYFILRQDVPPDPGWTSAYKFYSVKLEGDRAVLLGTHRISVVTGAFTPTEAGAYGYSSWHTITLMSADGKTEKKTERGSGDNMFYTYLEHAPRTGHLIGVYANRVVLWNKEGKVAAESGEVAQIKEIYMSADGDKFVTSADDGTATIWRTIDLGKLATYLQTPTGWVVAAADGRYEHSGDALKQLHYTANSEIVQLADFDKSFERRNLVAEILSGKVVTPLINPQAKEKADQEISKTLKGKIHSIAGGEVQLGGTGFQMGERVFVVVNGKPVRLKVHFPTHTGAKAKPEKQGELKLLKAGMPVFR